MSWADSGNNARIERANFDGTQRERIVETSSYQPVLLSLDLENERMYWSEGLQDSIVASDLNGENVEVLSQDITPSALDSRGKHYRVLEYEIDYLLVSSFEIRIALVTAAPILTDYRYRCLLERHGEKCQQNIQIRQLNGQWKSWCCFIACKLELLRSEGGSNERRET